MRRNWKYHGNTMSKQQPSILLLVVILVVLALFGAVGAKFMLNRHSASTMSHLAVVWPGIETMPEDDRALLVELALTCNVVDREPVRAEVVDCLRSSAATIRPSPSERLERLIVQAPQAASAGKH